LETTNVTMKYLLSLIISGALVVSGFGQTRNVLVGTNNAVVQPTNFWSADAVNARSGLGLGTAATSNSSAFQPSSLVLSNLASSNAVNLTNLRATNVVGTLSITQGGTGSTNAADARTAFGLGTAATNPASAFQPSSAVLSNLAAGSGIAITNIAASNIVGEVAVVNGGTGATNAATARTNLGLGWTALTNSDATNFRNAIGLGATNTDVVFNEIIVSKLKSTAVDPVYSFDLIQASFFYLTNVIFSWGGLEDFIFQVPVDFGSSSVAATTRTNLGLGWSALTNSNSATALLGYNTNNGNVIMPSSITFSNNVDFSKAIFARTNGVSAGGTLFVGSGSTISFSGEGDQPVWRTNLGLGLPALTNTNNVNFLASFFGSNTNPVLVNTNGEVVSPTNFWQVAPISTTVQYQTNVTGTSTNAATNSRNLFLFSLSPSVSGITNTVTLPTNTATTFEGDRATIIHLAQTTNAVTAIRQLGAATNLITLNQIDEAVLLMYRSGAWILADNISYVEPIFFSGTNAAANAAASRTNLGLGITNNVRLGSLITSYIYSLTTNANINLDDNSITLEGSSIEIRSPIVFGAGTNESLWQAQTRTNFGIPLPALTNTNNANFQAAVFATNAAPTNSANVNGIGFNTAVAWMEVTVSTNGTNHSFRIPLFR
jgi:hypothetical protein